ncbi:flagellar biosynthesis repressor FlbT [Paracoccus seriniphilus]|uniref:Flagellar protein FlbT n=1 Tax=Paracoccus seriniphilus TaxID=184748 RepID=A0A239PLL0_9RHOB|nr:flagellar biosynthesis repressor FlbT [Paracoccus seriniphilus]WCR13880.1 flagellar biosynthesis repressor FlbT [Paracoccus seriniphilus]SNT68497.1 flagellar protein FlbT [Paracoccus seriniphilus]
MTGLVLKLAPGERVLINGAVIENGERRTKLSIVTPNVNVLRLRDAIHPDKANTPVARACYIAQLILSGDADLAEGKKQLSMAIEQLSRVFDDRDSRRILTEATEHIVRGNAYQSLRRLRELLPREARLLSVRQ